MLSRWIVARLERRPERRHSAAAATAAARPKMSLRRIGRTGMIDRTDDDVAARGEGGGDEQHERQVSHGATITRGAPGHATEIFDERTTNS